MSLSALSAMEQYSQYLMGMKSNHILNLHFESTMNRYNNSWEEKAFADDAARPLGGFIWPPRSYSCSFCKREFRSAQALGGHMNVHRRDRARLKQALSPQNGVLHPCKSLDASYPSQVCFIDSNPNPSFLASAHSPSRVSAISTQENFSEDTYVSPFSSSIVQEQLKEFPHSSTPSWSDSKAAWLFSGPDSKTAFEKNVRKEDFRDDCVETNLSMGLNLVFSQNHPSGFDGDDEAITRKRHKTTASSIPFFLKRSSDETYGSMEDLDLELRLGDPPTVR